MESHRQYIQRCIQLAQLGFATVAPNPMVGAVLVYNHTIIGEGYHMQYGQAHAEVNCINDVAPHNQHLIALATLYVSLEPCNHYGKTPPCAHFIVTHKIKKVVIGCIDVHSKVNGQGINYLQQNGVTVVLSDMQNECIALNEQFFYSKKNERPYITLKWAQSADGFMNAASDQRTYITSHCTNTWVHKLRAAHQAIMVGSNTIQADNPMLNKRLFGNYNTTAIIIDRYLQLELIKKNVVQNKQVIIVNCLQQKSTGNCTYIKISDDQLFLQNALQQLYTLGIQSILVEGGAILLQLMLQQQLYNKIINITNETLYLQNGLAAPHKWNVPLQQQYSIQHNTIKIYSH
jgi:diaminohydroxyphosphoribosylaminopyrimidine deaminase / 5-amino-6-(5-phosphoribosylamino)uracil reductase